MKALAQFYKLIDEFYTPPPSKYVDLGSIKALNIKLEDEKKRVKEDLMKLYDEIQDEPILVQQQKLREKIQPILNLLDEQSQSKNIKTIRDILFFFNVLVILSLIASGLYILILIAS